MSEAPLVTVEQGQLQGRVSNSPSGKAYYSFQGIPYATPPLGSLRFKAPQPIEPWEGIRDATSEGNISAQIDPIFSKQYIGDENCLFLNVYTPNIDGSFLPVMVYIHGGGFKYGSGNTDFYGPDYLVEKDVVIVTLNYRLGALGFLSLNTPEVPGNAGVKDIVLALNWVKDNIHNFGGNSGNLTVFGESAGGVATCLLTASPLTKGMFNRAIVQSGTALVNQLFQKTPIENARNLAKSLGCDGEGVEEILDFLTATPSKDIVEAQEKLSPGELAAPFSLVVEKEFLGVDALITEPFIDLLTSGRVAHIPIMIGSTTLELAMERKSDDLQSFIPQELNIERNSAESIAIAEKIKQLYFKGSHTGVESLHEYYQLLSDFLINVNTHRYVRYLVQSTNVPIYYYKFDYVGELNVSGKIIYSLGLKHAMHMDDLGYLFKNDFQKEQEPTSQDLKMRERMVRLWTNFAKTGNPTPEENHYLTVTWQPVTKDNLYYLNLGSELSIAANPDSEKMEFWDDLYSKHFKIWDHPKSNNDTQVTFNSHTESQVIITSQVIETEDFVQITESVTLNSDAPELNSSADDVDAPKIVDDVEIIECAPEVVNEVPKTDDVQIPNEPEVDAVHQTSNTPEAGNAVQKISNDLQELGNAVQKTSNEIPEITSDVQKLVSNYLDNVTHVNGNGVEKKRPSNEIKVSNGAPKDVIRANDPPEDDLPKNIGVNKFVNFFESLGGKKK